MMLETGFLGTEETVILTGYKPKLTAKNKKMTKIRIRSYSFTT